MSCCCCCFSRSAGWWAAGGDLRISAPCSTVWLNSTTRLVSPRKLDILSRMMGLVSTELMPTRILGFFTSVSRNRSRSSLE